MSDNPSRMVDVMREKLQNDEYPINEADRVVLLDMSDDIHLLGSSEYSDHRHEFLLRRTVKLAKEVGGLADALDDRDAAEDLVRYINTEQTGSPETNKDYRVALRCFGDILTDGDEPPDSLEWIPGGYPDNYDPAPDPAEMLRWEQDVQAMIDACHNSRDRALVALEWDLGPRPGELFDMTVGTITDHEYGLQVTLDGKRGRRSPILIPSVPYVQQWLRNHPSEYSADPLFCNLTSTDPVTNNRIRDILKEVADRAGVEKPVTPTNFRKSSASFLASQGVSQAHLEDHHGWTRGSEVAARYIAVFDESNEREIAKAHGLEVEEDASNGLNLVVCPRCDQRTVKSERRCIHCNHALTKDAARDAQEQRLKAMESLADVDGELAEAVMTIEEAIGDDFSIRALLDDR